MKYRAEIDGLRFIAVVIVIIYHIRLNILDTNIFQGGFVGVDVFFVISGYLITRIIFNDIENKNFSFFYFIERRARRILPLLLFVSLFFLIIGILILRGESLLEFSKTILSSIFFYSNYFFLFNEVEYGVNKNLVNPFIHTWSLSIEEQYYILFPILIILLKKNINLIKILIILLFFASFINCIYGYNNYPKINFFLFSTRIWEILLGSIIAMSPIVRFKSLFLINFLTILGITLIFIPAFYFNDINENFPSYKNLFPTVGTALIIYFSNSKDFISKALSLRIFTFFGKISFSLYLIHMPVISLIRNTEIINATLINKFLSMTFIIIFSTLTYFFIEKLFRNKNLISINLFLKLIFLIYFFIISLFIYVTYKKGNVLSFNEEYQNLLITAEPSNPDDIDECIDKPLIRNNEEFQSGNIFNCYFDNNKEKDIYLIGDSNMINLSKSLLKNKNYNYYIYITTGCMFLPGYSKYNLWSNNEDAYCNKDYFSSIKQFLLNQKNSIFIFNYRAQVYFENFFYEPKNKWDYYYKKSENRKGINVNDFVDEYQKLTSNNNKILLVYPTPELDFDPYNKISNLLNLSRIKKIDIETEINNLGINYSDYYDRSKNSINVYDNTLNDNILKIDPASFICKDKKKNRCAIIIENGVLYEDDNHLSSFGSTKVADIIINSLTEINH
tara:strand:- start:282 stop:2303 length:2022 start_codon:yes stop_codon:yes gene_type:complete